MQTRRDALADAGLAIRGARGKFSKAANEWLVAQRAAGVKFSDDDAPVKTAKVKAETRTDETPTAPVKKDGDTPYLAPTDYRFPEGEYRAVSFKDGKKVVWSLRECCNTCRVSLVNHMCDTPTILGDIAVKIEPVK